jgi:hypothetical protein
MSLHDRRVRELIVGAWAPYLGFAMLLWGAELATLVVAAQACLPEVDLNAWTSIAVATPPLLAALFVNLFVGTVLFVRAFVRRKGRARAVHYLFPEVGAGNGGVLGRILLMAAGVRANQRGLR